MSKGRARSAKVASLCRAQCEAAVAGAEVGDAMGGEREREGEVDDSVPVEEEAEMAVDGDGVARLEIDGLRKSGGARGGGIRLFTVAFQIGRPLRAKPIPAAARMPQVLDNQEVAGQCSRWTDLRCSEFRSTMLDGAV